MVAQRKQTARSPLPFCVILINLILPNLPGDGAHQVQLGPLLIIRQLVADLARGKAALGLRHRFSRGTSSAAWAIRAFTASGSSSTGDLVVTRPSTTFLPGATNCSGAIAGTGVIKLQIKTIHMRLGKQNGRNRRIAAGAGPGGVIIAPAHMVVTTRSAGLPSRAALLSCRYFSAWSSSLAPVLARNC